MADIAWEHDPFETRTRVDSHQCRIWITHRQVVRAKTVEEPLVKDLEDRRSDERV